MSHRRTHQPLRLERVHRFQTFRPVLAALVGVIAAACGSDGEGPGSGARAPIAAADTTLGSDLARVSGRAVDASQESRPAAPEQAGQARPITSGAAITAPIGEHVALVAADSTAIRLRPDDGGVLIGWARRGDAFEAEHARGGWTAVFLFSGELRYVRTRATRRLDALPTPHVPDGRLAAAAELFERAETRATEMATSRYADLDRQVTYERVVADQLKLDALRRTGVPTSAHLRVAGYGLSP